MGFFNNLFGSTRKEESSSPSGNDLETLSREQIAHGGKHLSKRYWNSIYLGAYAPQMDMAVFKGTKLDLVHAVELVSSLHKLLGDGSLGETNWTDDDAFDLEGSSLHRSWTLNTEQEIQVDLDVDNFNASDDPVMLSIRPWNEFKEYMQRLQP